MLTSPRLIYRQIDATDREESLSMAQSNEVMTYITGAALSFEDAEKRFQYQLEVNKQNKHLGFIRAITIENGAFIGYIKMTPLAPNELEIGYAVLPEFWGKGYASEMLVAMENFAHKHSSFDTLVGIANTANSASIKVLVKRGFELLKKLKNESHYVKKLS